MTREKIMVDLFEFSAPTYYKWTKHQKRKIFNLLNFILLIGTSLITKNQITIITVTLIPLALFTIYIYVKNNDLNINLCLRPVQ